MAYRQLQKNRRLNSIDDVGILPAQSFYNILQYVLYVLSGFLFRKEKIKHHSFRIFLYMKKKIKFLKSTTVKIHDL